MHMPLSRFILTSLLVTVTGFAMAQPGLPARPDTTRRPNGGGSSQGPKPYKEVITSKAVSDAGLFWVHKVDDKYFFEIPDSLFNRDILVVNRLSKAAAGMRTQGSFSGYAGDDIGRNVIQFQKGPNNKIFIRNISFAEYTKDSTSSMYSAVNRSNLQPISASFDIKALGKDSTGAVIDITDFISGDNDVLHFSSSAKSFFRLSSIQNDKSYVDGIRSYPINIEIKTVKTYGRTPAPASAGGFGAAPPGGNMTVEINSSLVLLPKVPMQARYYDKRVGYFTVGYTDYDVNPQGVESIVMAKRWRLEPKPGDMEKYKRGELVEPQKPIVFYIDPATPKKWVPYLMQGVDDWKSAFEKAGFKNAIMAKLAPTKQEDSTWSLDDARNSAIVYKPSDIPNASGPSISDPRSGEIMESHINWYHNVMELLRDWYFVQCSPTDPSARKMVFDDELMGQLIRFVSSHEVGHTLGLRHNFGSSSTVPVENLRNKAWVEANGHTPSIMDYARFNYVAQPEDNISQKGLFPRIGDYDNWAIEWGYRLFPQFKSAEDEKGHLNQWVIDKMKNRRLWWGDGETNRDDSRNQTEDLGDDAMKASMYGIKNLQRIIPNLVQWTKEENKDYSGLKQMYGQVTSQLIRYSVHVARNVGGVMLTPKMVEETGAVYENVPKAKQKEAVDFLNKNVFATPTWLINNDIFNRTGDMPANIISGVQNAPMQWLLSGNTFDKLINAEATSGAANTYTMTELMSDLKKGIFTELATAKPIDLYRRNLQKSYVGILGGLLNPQVITVAPGFSATIGGVGERSDSKSILRAHLVSLRTEISGAAGRSADTLTKYHLQDLADRIGKILDPNK